MTTREERGIVALERAGWRVDEVQSWLVVEGSDGGRYRVAVWFDNGDPSTIEYADGETGLVHQEDWHEAPGVLSPSEVARLFHNDTKEEE